MRKALKGNSQVGDICLVLQRLVLRMSGNVKTVNAFQQKNTATVKNSFHMVTLTTSLTVVMDLMKT